MVAIVSYNGTVVFSQLTAINVKLPSTLPLPPLPPQDTLGTQCQSPVNPLWQMRGMCLSWLGATVVTA